MGTYNAAILACLTNTRFDEAVRLVIEMAQAGCETRLATYSTSVGAWEDIFDWEGAVDKLEHIRSCDETPTSSACEVVLRICEVAKQWKVMLSLLDNLQDDGVPLDFISRWRQDIARHMQTPQERWEAWFATHQFRHINSQP